MRENNTIENNEGLFYYYFVYLVKANLESVPAFGKHFSALTYPTSLRSRELPSSSDGLRRVAPIVKPTLTSHVRIVIVSVPCGTITVASAIGRPITGSREWTLVYPHQPLIPTPPSTEECVRCACEMSICCVFGTFFGDRECT